MYVHLTMYSFEVRRLQREVIAVAPPPTSTTFLASSPGFPLLGHGNKKRAKTEGSLVEFKSRALNPLPTNDAYMCHELP